MDIYPGADLTMEQILDALSRQANNNCRVMAAASRIRILGPWVYRRTKVLSGLSHKVPTMCSSVNIASPSHRRMCIIWTPTPPCPIPTHGRAGKNHVIDLSPQPTWDLGRIFQVPTYYRSQMHRKTHLTGFPPGFLGLFYFKYPS